MSTTQPIEVFLREGGMLLAEKAWLCIHAWDTADPKEEGQIVICSACDERLQAGAKIVKTKGPRPPVKRIRIELFPVKEPREGIAWSCIHADVNFYTNRIQTEGVQMASATGDAALCLACSRLFNTGTIMVKVGKNEPEPRAHK